MRRSYIANSDGLAQRGGVTTRVKSPSANAHWTAQVRHTPLVASQRQQLPLLPPRVSTPLRRTPAYAIVLGGHVHGSSQGLAILLVPEARASTSDSLRRRRPELNY